MEEARTLDRLAVGRQATVRGVSAPADQRRRLLELGFMPGRTVEALQESPWGDPVAYFVCGAVIALRRADAGQIEINEGA